MPRWQRTSKNPVDFCSFYARGPVRGLCVLRQSFRASSVCRPPSLVLAMARHAQTAKVTHLVAAALALGHDVVNVGTLAMHHSATHLALVVVPDQHLTPCRLPPLRAVPTLVSVGPHHVRCSSTRASVDPRRPKRGYTVGHQPLARMVAVSPLAAVLFSTSLMNGAANTSSGMA